MSPVKRSRRCSLSNPRNLLCARCQTSSRPRGNVLRGPGERDRSQVSGPDVGQEQPAGVCPLGASGGGFVAPTLENEKSLTHCCIVHRIIFSLPQQKDNPPFFLIPSLSDFPNSKLIRTSQSRMSFNACNPFPSNGKSHLFLSREDNLSSKCVFQSQILFQRAKRSKTNGRMNGRMDGR